MDDNLIGLYVYNMHILTYVIASFDFNIHEVNVMTQFFELLANLLFGKGDIIWSLCGHECVYILVLLWLLSTLVIDHQRSSKWHHVTGNTHIIMLQRIWVIKLNILRREFYRLEYIKTVVWEAQLQESGGIFLSEALRNLEACCCGELLSSKHVHDASGKSSRFWNHL